MNLEVSQKLVLIFLMHAIIQVQCNKYSADNFQPILIMGRLYMYTEHYLPMCTYDVMGIFLHVIPTDLSIVIVGVA